MQFENKETNKNYITDFIAYLIIAIIATALCLIIFIKIDLIVKPTLPKNALDNITVTNIDKVSGTTTFTNKTGDIIEYTNYTDASAIKTGWYKIKVNDIKYTMSNKDGQMIQKLAYIDRPLSIDCLKSDTDILPGTNAKITKQFTDYLMQNKIYNDIIFRSYSPTTKQLTYSVNNGDPKMITLTLSNIGFYKTSEVDDNDLYCQTNTKDFISILIFTVVIFILILIWLGLTWLIGCFKVQKSQKRLSTANMAFASSSVALKNKVNTVLENHKDKNNIKKQTTTPKHKPSSTICSPGSKKERK